MPTRSPVRCTGCRRLHSGKGLCPDCKQDRYQDRRWIYNSREWALLRDQVLSEEPVCRECRSPAPGHVDHIRTIAERPDLALVRTNLQRLCDVCHGRKTRREG
jgi:5-methylcytosine-specific restriction endonuclease McrA